MAIIYGLALLSIPVIIFKSMSKIMDRTSSISYKAKQKADYDHAYAMHLKDIAHRPEDSKIIMTKRFHELWRKPY